MIQATGEGEGCSDNGIDDIHVIALIQCCNLCDTSDNDYIDDLYCHLVLTLKEEEEKDMTTILLYNLTSTGIFN